MLATNQAWSQLNVDKGLSPKDAYLSLAVAGKEHWRDGTVKTETARKTC